MKSFLLLILVLGGPMWSLLTGVHERNVAVAAGAAAYAQGNAAAAAAAFAAALAARPQRVPDPRLLLNLAHAQAWAGQPAAQATYGRLLANTPALWGSVARQQLAVLTAQKGEIAQALSLLRQALLLDPNNSDARFDYEVLSDYLAQRPSGPKISPPNAPKSDAPKSTPDKNAADKTQPATKAGTDHQGEINDPKPAPATPNTPPTARPSPAGQPDNRQPSANPGQAAAGGRAPGAGTPQALASGEEPGSQRGLDRSSTTPVPTVPGRNNRPGTETATPADLNLQTQRERLQAMNLSPTQARQLLETLRAQEQQYLQQLTHPATQKPDPNKPTW